MQPSDYEHLTPAQAIAYQHELRKKIDISPLSNPINTIAGADISFDKYSDVVYAGIVVFSYPELKVIGTSTAICKPRFLTYPVC